VTLRTIEVPLASGIERMLKAGKKERELALELTIKKKTIYEMPVITVIVDGE